MLSSPPPVHPIERLIWEHSSLLEQIDELLAMVGKGLGDNWVQIDAKANFSMRFLDLHQESEDRFLFPLISELGDALMHDLREEHRNLFQASDSLIAVLRTRNEESFIHTLRSLRRDLSSHFLSEETCVFANAEKLLSPVQMDILRIKFATRKVG